MIYLFDALVQLEEFKNLILSSSADICFGNMEFYYSLSFEEYSKRLKIWQVDVDDNNFPYVITKGCINIDISDKIKNWSENSG